MEHVVSLDTLVEVMLAISLSAAAGFRVFVPLLALSIAFVFGHLDLPTNFDWLETPQATALFAVACVLEISGYYIPWFDHLLDLISTPAAFITGTIVAASLAPNMNPLVQWTTALIAGGGTAGLTKGLMNFFRIASTAVSGGVTNPILATLELVAAVTLCLLALTVPLLAGVLAIAFLVFAIQRVWKVFSRAHLQTP